MEQEIKPKVTMGVLHTIANSIYSSPRLKIKEAVTNSMDNNAKKFVFYYDNILHRIVFFDDGDGIDFNDINNIFSTIGYSDFRADKNKHSYFGLGLISVLAFGEQVHILSQKQNKQFYCTIDSKSIFDRENMHKDIVILKDYIEFHDTEAELSLLNIIEKDKFLNDTTSNFTMMIIEDVYKNYWDYLNEDKMIMDLRCYLPLKTHSDEPFLSQIVDCDKKKKIKEILGIGCASKWSPSIDFFLKRDEKEDYKQLYKFYPKMDNLFFDESSITVKEGNDWAIYILHQYNELFDENNEPGMDFTGLWLRNRNVLVQKNYYFEYGKHKYLHKPLKKWIYGEVFHNDMEKFLVVTRDELLFENEDCINFIEEVGKNLKDLNEPLRRVYTHSKQVEKSIVKPLLDFSLKDVENKLKVMGYITKDNIFRILENISNNNSELKQENDKYIENILSRSDTDILLYTSDKDRVNIVLTKNITKDKDSKLIKGINGKDIVEIRVNSNLFLKKEPIEFFGDKYQVKFTINDANKTFYIDQVDKCIFLNMANDVLVNYNLTVVDILFAFEISYYYFEEENNIKGFKECFYNFLSNPDKLYTQYANSMFKSLNNRRISIL